MVKIREDDGGEEKSVIKSIVNMVQYGCSRVSVCRLSKKKKKNGMTFFLLHANNSSGS